MIPCGGFAKDLLGKIGQCGNSKTNACRNLHTLINKTDGVTLPLPLGVCSIPIRVKRPLSVKQVWWPMLRIDSWLAYFLKEKPQMILGGHDYSDSTSWKAMLAGFWNTYRRVDEHHKVFSSGIPLDSCIPYMLHGDEGRGQCHVPSLVISWQPVVSFLGPRCYSDCSQLGPT